jgi:hypothetical protein
LDLPELDILQALQSEHERRVEDGELDPVRVEVFQAKVCGPTRWPSLRVADLTIADAIDVFVRESGRSGQTPGRAP